MPRVFVEYRSASREIWTRFCEVHPEVKLSFDEWKTVIYGFNYSFRDYLLETGERGKLPWGFGPFCVSGKKPKRYRKNNGREFINMPPDWGATRKAGKMVYHLNSHSGGRKFKWLWFIRESTLYQSDIWSFKPSRKSSRKVNEYLSKPNGQYSEIYKQWNR